MAVQSIIVSAEHVYYYWHNKVGSGNHFYGPLEYNYVSSDYVIIHNYNGDTQPSYLLAQLPDLTDTLGCKRLYRVEPTVRMSGAYDGSPYFLAVPLRGELPDLGSKTYIQAPSLELGYDSFPRSQDFPDYVQAPGIDCTLTTASSATAKEMSLTARRFLDTKTCAFGYPFRSTHYTITLYTSLLNGTPPSFVIYYDDTETTKTKISSVSGPTNGYRNPRKSIVVTASLAIADDETYSSMTVPDPASKTIYWRETGSSTWQTYTAVDSSIITVIPANTFPADTSIEWYLSVTDEGGYTSVSETYTFSTADGESTATPTAPKDSVENGAKPIEFTWTVSNPTAEPPSRVRAEWAVTEDAETWTTLFDESSAIYSYEAPGGTFPGGNIYWRVTSYNADGDEGPTSGLAVFQCIAPPDPPVGIQGDGAPYTTISWQANTQTAFEISVDGKQVTKQFGIGVYSYKLKEPLADGEHEVSIRVQSAFGYWSNPGTGIIAVINGGIGTLDLTARFDVDAELSWTLTSNMPLDTFHIYRDGVLIANTVRTVFTDRRVLGEHVYHVVAEMTGGHYCLSEEISGRLKSCVTRIAPLDGGDWIDLLLSENSNSVQSFNWSREITLRHYAGSAYPVAEMSPYIDRIATYDCAFQTVSEAAAFEALRGRAVILKSRGGEVMVGVLSQINKIAGEFYLSYSFSVQQIHWEDLINDTYS